MRTLPRRAGWHAVVGGHRRVVVFDDGGRMTTSALHVPGGDASPGRSRRSRLAAPMSAQAHAGVAGDAHPAATNHR